ncbi:MAG TPA: hypothetical protein VD997_01805 [Phycisphaerales bacterium]|nr:hypothetical protein [Phycisphaerales bacterium]
MYRLNLEDEEPSLYQPDLKALRSDADIERVIELACTEGFDERTATETTELTWALRSFTRSTADDGGTLVVVQLIRALRSKVAPTLTDGGVVEDRTEFHPAPAEYVHLIFRMSRHAVAVEYRSALLGTEAWRGSLQRILGKSAAELGFGTRIELEAIPEKNEIMEAFASFDKLTRMKVVLRLPNPEISRSAQDIYKRMQDGGVREWVQKMYNPRGLSQASGQLPHASAELAQAGYKKGGVEFQGVKNGERKAVKTGRKAARGSIDTARDVARGMLANARTKETKTCLEQLIREMDAVSPPPNGSTKKMKIGNTKKGRK